MRWTDFESFITDGIEPQKGRTIVLATGMSGLDLINYEFKRQNAIDCAEWLHEVKFLATDQLESLKKMMGSSDRENGELAITIIEQKKHEYNLQRGGS
jgi:hypothetical protein